MSDTAFDSEKRMHSWIAGQRQVVVSYLERQSVNHRGVAAEPEWHVAPYVAIWRIASYAAPGRTGWWAVSGDVPTDYISSSDAHTPREAMRLIGQRWLDCAQSMSRRAEYSAFHIGRPADWKDLAPLLEARAKLFIQTAGDDANW